MTTIRRLTSDQPDFDARLQELLAFESAQDAAVESAVAGILAGVKTRGDAALLDYTRRFDRVEAASVAALEVPAAEARAALGRIPAKTRKALEAAAARVRTFHERQLTDSWSYREANGTELGQRVTALDLVGIYVPGGKAAYPSSVIMNALPAKVAGVREIIMVVPAPGGERNDLVLAAASICGVERVFTIGGAQAVAALAYGTATVPAVDKIVGPGNAYVAAAKRRVFGVVGIDMIAGPSEIVVVCDGSAAPDWVAMDLFAQAEHDELAQAILITPDLRLLEAVAASIERQLADMPRRDVIAAALHKRGALIRVRDLDEACEVVNRIAPEHLELAVKDPDVLLPAIRHAGAIFLGPYSSEALGDYCAGPNHVLPTSRTARFSSPLGVYDFQKRSSVIRISKEAARELGAIAVELARGEGLTAHARSAEYRMKIEKA
ncbi:MAG: histidinol dehydrogenase [Betaproteobacteria bacterium]|nr:histidinol dehydrogenase [Betaproteobacteria bacterium]MDH3435580.1 histidinol dehydrogenase [Betaproteobacteria bacterium]